MLDSMYISCASIESSFVRNYLWWRLHFHVTCITPQLLIWMCFFHLLIRGKLNSLSRRVDNSRKDLESSSAHMHIRVTMCSSKFVSLCQCLSRSLSLCVSSSHENTHLRPMMSEFTCQQICLIVPPCHQWTLSLFLFLSFHLALHAIDIVNVFVIANEREREGWRGRGRKRKRWSSYKWRKSHCLEFFSLCLREEDGQEKEKINRTPTYVIRASASG